MTVIRQSVLAAALAAAQDAAREPSRVEQAGGDSFTLNFKEADIGALVATVSEITGRNFVVDPRVKGEVTVLSNRSMTGDELYETFLSVLEVHGFSAVPAGEVIKIVPQVNAKQDGGFGDVDATREDIVTRVMRVENVPAEQLVPILRPLVPQYGHLAAYPASNILIISDRSANVQRMSDIVRRIDRQGTQEVEILRLEHANAQEVVRVVDQLKSDAGRGGQAFSVIPDVRTNSVLIAGDESARLRLRAIVADLDTPRESQGGTQVIYLDYAEAESLAEVLKTFTEGRAPGSGEGESQGGARIIAEPAANALVVTAPAALMREIRGVIDKLDIRRGQVLVEAIIAEVTIDRSRELGVEVAVYDQERIAAASILDPETLQAIPGIAGDGSPLGLIQRGLNIAGGRFREEGTSFAVLLKALSGDANTNVLSTPSLLTMDNEEAQIKVGQEVPFITGQFTNTGTGQGVTNPFQTVERRDVGLTLGITPQINAGNTIRLQINQEVSSISEGATGAVDLITNNRSLKTSVEVADGQILVLGGLIDDNVIESRQRVPLLGAIPVLGELFTSRSVTKTKQNLLNFIRVKVLRGEGAASYYTRQKYDYLRELQREQRATSIPLMRKEERPMAPPIESYDDEPGGKRRGDRPDPSP
jgi:general secretion pathway protein D